MDGAGTLPLWYIPLAWLGVLGTSTTYAVDSRRAHARDTWLSRARLLSPLAFAMGVYTAWTLVAAFILVLLLRLGGFSPSELGLGRAPSLSDVGLALVGVAIGLGWWPLAERFARIFRAGEAATSRLNVGTGRPAGRQAAWLTGYAVIAVPPLEELIFRGYVYASLRPVLPVVATVLATSAIFASIHIAYGGEVVVFALGMSVMLCVVYQITNNLYAAIFTHALVNVWGFVIPRGTRD